MNAAELLAKKYLQNLSLGEVVFEPDGNIPPDFSINGDIGVEVRRLNQNYENSDGSTEGLEQLAIPLWQRMRSFLPGLGRSHSGESWYVCMQFGRPIGPWKTIREQLENQLTEFMRRPHRERAFIQITENFSIDLLRAGKAHADFFLLGATIDDDSGGWVVAEAERNLRVCIAEKEEKVSRYKKRYREWWLVLVDHINYGMDQEDREIIRKDVMPSIRHSFDRIVILDPLERRSAFEI